MLSTSPSALGDLDPGPSGRGVSLPAFLRYFPDEASCIDHLFWVRGGHRAACRKCGNATSWHRPTALPNFYSACCGAKIIATKGTWFYKSRPLWEWFYTILLVLNLGSSPSSLFLARHLGTTPGAPYAWRQLLRIREHCGHICEQASESLRGQTVHVERLSIRNVLSGRLRKTNRMSVLVISTPRNVFAFHLAARRSVHCREILDRLGVARDIYTFDPSFAALAKRLKHYTVHQISHENEPEMPDIWRCFTIGSAFSVYLRRTLNKRRGFIGRTHLQSYLDEYVFRFNFANDKAMLFPLFMINLPRIE